MCTGSCTSWAIAWRAVGLRDNRLVRRKASLALAHVTVIDLTAAASRRDLTIVIEGNRISAMAKTGDVAIPANASVLDASGAFVARRAKLADSYRVRHSLEDTGTAELGKTSQTANQICIDGPLRRRDFIARKLPEAQWLIVLRRTQHGGHVCSSVVA